MAHLIYRGTAHDNLSIARPQIARTMIYRGMQHDGVSAAVPGLGQRIAMVYRGVRYLALAGGLTRDIIVPVDQAAPARPFGAARTA